MSVPMFCSRGLFRSREMASLVRFERTCRAVNYHISRIEVKSTLSTVVLHGKPLSVPPS